MAGRTYRSAGRADQARRTRRRILEAAAEAFLLRGYVGATLTFIARTARVSVPTVEACFGTKAALLKAAIDVAIVGDDEPVPVLGRGWTVEAARAETGQQLIDVVSGVVAAAQERSAGLVAAALDGAPTQPDLEPVVRQLVDQRLITARWIADQIAARGGLRRGWDTEAATDLLWTLMEPALYVRLVRDRCWSSLDYRRWWSRAASLLLDDRPAADPTTEGTTR